MLNNNACNNVIMHVLLEQRLGVMALKWQWGGGGVLLKTLRSRFGHLTANGKPWFSVSVSSLPVCPYLGVKIHMWQLEAAMFVFIHSFTPIQAEKSTSKLLLYEKEFDVISKQKDSEKQYILSNMGSLCLKEKTPRCKSLTLRVWSSHTNVNIKLQT